MFADAVAAVELVGFRIVGDAATPLGVGLFVRDAGISIVDVEIIGATRVAIDFSGGSAAGLVGSDIHDNPGAGAGDPRGSVAAHRAQHVCPQQHVRARADAADHRTRRGAVGF